MSRAIKVFALVFLLGVFGVAPVNAAELSQVSDIRHWTGPKYTRVVVDLTGSAKYEVKRLSNPSRIFIDFSGANLRK